MKRTSQIALVLMSATAVGTGAYSLLPRDNCQPGAAPNAECGSQSSGGSSARGWGSGSSSRSNPPPSSGSQQTSSLGTTMRNGFGSIGRAIAGFGRAGG